MLKRLALPLVAGLVACVSPAPALAGRQGGTATVKVTRCSRALGEAVFRGKMREVAGGDRMWMRFSLLERTGPNGFQPLQAPGLGKWRKSRHRVGAFAYKQAVRNLSQGGVYRVRVDYRWYSADGDIIAHARRKSSTCPHMWALPNLRVHFAGVRETSDPDADRYWLRVTNTGRGPAKNAVVRLSVDGNVAATTTTSLAAGGSQLIRLRGPTCQTWVEAAVDPDGLIAETSEQDNTRELACADLTRR